MTDIKTWSTSAGNNNAASPDGFPEGMAPSGVNNSAREVMAAIRRQMETGGWFDHGITPSWQSSASFSLSTDLTNVFTVGRPVELYGSAMGTAYSQVKSSTYVSPLTTITINDSAVGSTISQVRYSLLQDSSLLPEGLNGNYSISGSLAVSSGITTENLTVNGNQTVSGSLVVLGTIDQTATFTNRVQSTKAAATGFTRISPNKARITNNNTTHGLSAGTNTISHSISNATCLHIELSGTLFSEGSAGAYQSIVVQGYTDALSNAQDQFRMGIMEQVSISASGAALLQLNDRIDVNLSSRGSKCYLYLTKGGKSTHTCTWEITGYDE